MAMTMSTPASLRGDAEERTRRGVAEEAFVAEGKVTSCARAVAFVATVVDALHVRFVRVGAGAAAHNPSVEAVADGDDAQRHDVQPGVMSAADEQQQPPRQRSDAQSAETPHVSPGERARHAPDWREQPEQPRRTAVGEQHAPERQTPEAQAAFNEHAIPEEQPEVAIARILRLETSETYKIPEEERVIPYGLLKLALAPAPSIVPRTHAIPVQPASVVTMPPVMARIL